MECVSFKGSIPSVFLGPSTSRRARLPVAVPMASSHSMDTSLMEPANTATPSHSSISVKCSGGSASPSFTAKPIMVSSIEPVSRDSLSHPLPPTPTFPSSHSMAGFLRAYGQVLQRVSSESIKSAEPDGCPAFSGDALASAGNTVLNRIKIGLLALAGHPAHVRGCAGGENWERKEHQLEWCLHELETDVTNMAASHRTVPPPALLSLTALHCAYAAKLVSQL